MSCSLEKAASCLTGVNFTLSCVFDLRSSWCLRLRLCLCPFDTSSITLPGRHAFLPFIVVWTYEVPSSKPACQTVVMVDCQLKNNPSML